MGNTPSATAGTTGKKKAEAAKPGRSARLSFFPGKIVLSSPDQPELSRKLAVGDKLTVKATIVPTKQETPLPEGELVWELPRDKKTKGQSPALVVEGEPVKATGESTIVYAAAAPSANEVVLECKFVPSGRHKLPKAEHTVQVGSIVIRGVARDGTVGPAPSKVDHACTATFVVEGQETEGEPTWTVEGATKQAVRLRSDMDPTVEEPIVGRRVSVYARRVTSTAAQRAEKQVTLVCRWGTSQAVHRFEVVPAAQSLLTAPVGFDHRSRSYCPNRRGDVLIVRDRLQELGYPLAREWQPDGTGESAPRDVVDDTIRALRFFHAQYIDVDAQVASFRGFCPVLSCAPGDQVLADLFGPDARRWDDLSGVFHATDGFINAAPVGCGVVGTDTTLGDERREREKNPSPPMYDGPEAQEAWTLLRGAWAVISPHFPREANATMTSGFRDWQRQRRIILGFWREHKLKILAFLVSQRGFTPGGDSEARWRAFDTVESSISRFSEGDEVDMVNALNAIKQPDDPELGRTEPERSAVSARWQRDFAALCDYYRMSPAAAAARGRAAEWREFYLAATGSSNCNDANAWWRWHHDSHRCVVLGTGCEVEREMVDDLASVGVNLAYPRRRHELAGTWRQNHMKLLSRYITGAAGGTGQPLSAGPAAESEWRKYDALLEERMNAGAWAERKMPEERDMVVNILTPATGQKVDYAKTKEQLGEQAGHLKGEAFDCVYAGLKELGNEKAAGQANKDGMALLGKVLMWCSAELWPERDGRPSLRITLILPETNGCMHVDLQKA